MANSAILQAVAVATAWSNHCGIDKKILDLSCGDSETARLLARLGYRVIATDDAPPSRMSRVFERVGGVDLSYFLPFQQSSFDAVDLVEVIEHIGINPPLIREIARVLRPGRRVLISTPNILNVVSRLCFLFTGFRRGRVRPAHYIESGAQYLLTAPLRALLFAVPLGL